MTIYPFDQAAVSNTDLVCRQSRFWAMFGLLFGAVWTGAGVYMLMVKDDMLPIGIVWIAIGGLYGAAMLRRTIMVYSASNWLMRWNGQRMLIRLTWTHDRATANVRVLEIPRSEIEGVCRCNVRDFIQEAEGARNNSRRYLEIKTKIELPDELFTHLRDVGNPNPERRLQITSAMPVVALPGGIIRLLWMSSGNVTTPGIKKTLKVLAGDLPLLPEKSEKADVTADKPDAKKQDDQIIALAQAGKTIDAIKLARTQYGFSLADAKQFVDELRTAQPGQKS